MTRLVVGTDGTETSNRLATYLEGAVDADDAVYLVNSLVGGDRTTPDDITGGKEALELLAEATPEAARVESDQFVLGNHPVEDLLRAADKWDADEFVIGVRKHSPVGKVVFGSTAQHLLLEAERPVRCVPLISE